MDEYTNEYNIKSISDILSDIDAKDALVNIDILTNTTIINY